MLESVICSGYCPELDRENEIRVDFVEIMTLGAPKMQYKKDGFFCEHRDDHDCKTENMRRSGVGCPIYHSATFGG